jgi:hypothetical protein
MKIIKKCEKLGISDYTAQQIRWWWDLSNALYSSASCRINVEGPTLKSNKFSVQVSQLVL